MTNKPNSTMENVKTVNSAIRTLLLVGFLGLFGWLSWLGFDHWIKPGLDNERVKKEMAELLVKYEHQTEQLMKTKTALKLVKVDHRKAFIKVLEKGTHPETDEPFFIVEFTEVDEKGKALSEPRQFHLRGSLMFVDCWIVKFDDKYIEDSDLLRSASLCVFKSIYGDIDERSGGYSLDQDDNAFNTAYGTADPKSDFEQKIWDDFWAISNNPQLQEELGIRANHGQANYLMIEAGKVYEVDLRASDGATLKQVREEKVSTSGPSG